MPGLTHADRVGIATAVKTFLEKNPSELRKRGIDPDHWLALLSKALDEAIETDVKQEGAKADLMNKTIAARKADRAMYVLASGLIDLLGGAYGKDSTVAESLRRIRSHIHRRKRAKAPAA